MKIKSLALFLVVPVLAVSIFVYYRYAKDVLPKPGEVAVAPVAPAPAAMPTPTPTDAMKASKEVSADVTYDAYEGKMDHLRFVVTVDKDGIIETVQTLDFETGQIPEKKKEFNGLVNVVLKGKKLSTLTAIDKVGESSKTTDAFNKVLPTLQAAL